MSDNKKNRNIINLLAVAFGTALIALGVAVFLVPFDLVAGGLGGIAIVIVNIASQSALSADGTVAVLSLGFFLLGFITLGRKFALKTLLSAIAYPMFFSAFRRLSSPDILAGFFYLQGSEHGEIAIVMAALLGGALVGVGCALAILGGGSTGGVDIPALLICKLFPQIKSSVALFFIDALTVLVGAFVIGDPVISMLGILSAAVSAFTMDKVLLGGERGLVAEIISDKPDKILSLVIDRLDRTATLIDAVGGYSGEKRTVVSVSFTPRQYSELLKLVAESDPAAFLTVYRAYSIHGEGWRRRL